MKLAVSTFLLLLLSAHAMGDLDHQLSTPLSQFRDDSLDWLGYLLFGVLLVVGALYTLALARSRRPVDAGIAVFALLLLIVVAATPSFDGYHQLCALLLLVMLFAYYAVLLHRAGSIWMLVHLAVPWLLLGLTCCHSYGLWQKSFILYCVIAAAIHHHLLGQSEEPDRRPRAARTSPLRRRKVYALEPGRDWARRARARGETRSAP